jgi:hypothetical protein
MGVPTPFYELKPSALECVLDEYLFHGKRLHQFIHSTGFVLTATDLFSGKPFYITRSGSGLRPRRIRNFPGESGCARIARAVCASAAFPALLPPVGWRLRQKERDEYRTAIGEDRKRFFPHDQPLTVFLTDGGVSDNIGITFFLQLIYGDSPYDEAKQDTQIKLVMAYDAGREALLQPATGSMSKTWAASIKFLDHRKELLNDFIVRLAARESGIRYMLFRYDWGLEDDPRFGRAILNRLMRIRTDFNQFTDTEIYALSYCGYRTAVFGLLRAGLIKPEAVGDREALEIQFANIMDGLLQPLPTDQWEKHLDFSDSMFWASRTLGRMLSRVLLRNN